MLFLHSIRLKFENAFVVVEVEALDEQIAKRAAELAAPEFLRSEKMLKLVSDDERRFHEDVILDAALRQARDEAKAAA